MTKEQSKTEPIIKTIAKEHVEEFEEYLEDMGWCRMPYPSDDCLTHPAHDGVKGEWQLYEGFLVHKRLEKGQE